MSKIYHSNGCEIFLKRNVLAFIPSGSHYYSNGKWAALAEGKNAILCHWSSYGESVQKLVWEDELLDCDYDGLARWQYTAWKVLSKDIPSLPFPSICKEFNFQ